MSAKRRELHIQQDDTGYINARFSAHLLLVVKAKIERAGN
jgi:hypothetical protein